MGHMEEIWELLKASLPEFKLPELPSTEEKAMSEERNKEETPVVSHPTQRSRSSSYILARHCGMGCEEYSQFYLLKFLLNLVLCYYNEN